MTKEYLLNGLGCANCSAKIEKEVNKLDYVTEAVMNFATTKLTLETKSNEEKKILEDITRIATSIEKQIKVVYVNKEKIIEDRKISEKEQCCKHQEEKCCQEEKCSQEGNHHDDSSHTSHQHENNFGSIAFIKIGFSVFLLILAILLNINEYLKLVIYAVSYIIVGYDVLWRAIKNIFKGEVFDENFLMAIATVGAFAIGEYPEGIAVMLFYQLGEYFQERAVSNSRKSIADLMDIKPDYANLIDGDEVRQVACEEVGIEDIILIRPGEKVPLDGIIIEGNSMMNTTALTGESVPRRVEESDTVLSGFVNESSVLKVKVTKSFEDSTVSKILEMVSNAASKKSPTEKFITKFSRYYTPLVVIAAAALAIIPPLLLKDQLFSDWIYRALTFLVISCPCALVISVPLGFFGGIGAASKAGVLVKGGNYLEALTLVDTVIFDKTGTLTKGVFKVVGMDTANGFTKEDILYYGASAETYSTHPISKAIIEAYGEVITPEHIKSCEEVSGHGIEAVVDDKVILAGNGRLMERHNIVYNKINSAETLVYLAIDGKYAGCIRIADQLKEDAKSAINNLRNAGISNLVMLTGDKKEVADKISMELNMSQVYSELLPIDKVERLTNILEQKNKNKLVAFVGDGINDAPVLARADVGIAMGGLGSDAAIEAADVVLMTDEPSKILSAILVAKKTKSVVIQNIILALGIKGIILILGTVGLATMWMAVFADVGVSLIAIINSMRILRYKVK